MLLLAVSLSAQNNTSSPYSRFGYGELNDNVPGAYRAMGSVGLGMRNSKVINPSQPASYSVVDSATFMFDIGASGMWTNHDDAYGKRDNGSGNLEYLTLQVPFWKYIGFSAGVMPYSMVGYNLTENDTTANHPFTRQYYGKGGVTEVYGGLSFNIMNWVALGANIYYMFGEINNTRSLTFSDSFFTNVNEQSALRVSDLRFRYGLQFFHTFKEKHTIVLGAVFEHKSRFNVRYLLDETIRRDTIIQTDDRNGFGLPMMYGIGASYTYDNRLTVALDYSVTNWSQINYFAQTGLLKDRGRISVGAEYRHNALSKKYAERMPWRLGFSMCDSYLHEIPSKEFTVSLGFGFPLRNIGTVINTSFEYGHRGSADTLEENFIRFTLNAQIVETWFLKRKL
ncbi:MAG: hypothetical protein IJ834_08310 [Paludibacteraceae bacterium]|nr:hypothetical protein [Paludibacteraceae bacterium]